MATPAGYHFGDDVTTGFSFTHLSGAGCNAKRDFPVFPVLDAWDRTTDADSRGALLFTTWVDQMKQPDGVTNAGWRIAYDIRHPLIREVLRLHEVPPPIEVK